MSFFSVHLTRVQIWRNNGHDTDPEYVLCLMCVRVWVFSIFDRYHETAPMRSDALWQTTPNKQRHNIGY